jgi:hypothetical protein
MHTPLHRFSSVIQPFVLNVLQIMGDQSGTLHELKLSHDDDCKDQVDLMFYPPAPEQ